jgi:hypothetical protein
VPFVADRSKIVRMAYPGTDNVGRTAPQELPPEKYQSSAYLEDELDRIIDFDYLQDFALPGEYPGLNLSNIAKQWQGSNLPSPDLKLYDWYYPVGAGRWSIFRGLATSSMVKAMLSATTGATKPAQFVMQANPISPSNPNNLASNFTIKSNMYMLPARPLSEHGGQFDGLYVVTIVDERWLWQYNPITVRLSKSSTWSGLISQLATALGVTITVTTPIEAAWGQPEMDSQFWCNYENAATLLDALAWNLGRNVVRALNGTYTFQNWSDSNSNISTALAVFANAARIAGGDLFYAGTAKLPVGSLVNFKNSVLPGSGVVVTFPKYVQPSADTLLQGSAEGVPHYLNSRYTNQRPSAWYEQSYGDAFPITTALSSISGFGSLTGLPTTHIIHSTAKALYTTEAGASSGNNPVNYSGLNAMANQITTNYLQQQTISALDQVFPGTFLWTPEGIHDLIWSYSAKSRIASLRVMRSEWNQICREMQHGSPALSGYTTVPRGIGGHSVAQTIRDSFSGQISTTLSSSMASGDSSFSLTVADNLPTQNRWRADISSGKVDYERVYCEGTSGTPNSIGIVFRGIDNTIQQSHANGAVVQQVNPNVQYGVNLTTTEKMGFVYPSEWSSGGLQGVRVVPQTQSVKCLAGSGTFAQSPLGTAINTIDHWSGYVNSYDATQKSGSQFPQQEAIWIVERNGRPLQSGKRYDGQLAGYSKAYGGTTYPVYAVNEYQFSGSIISGAYPFGSVFIAQSSGVTGSFPVLVSGICSGAGVIFQSMTIGVTNGIITSFG